MESKQFLFRVDIYLEIILCRSKSTTDVLFTLQINLLFSMDSFTVFSDCSYIKTAKFSAFFNLQYWKYFCFETAPLIGGAGTERTSKLTGSEEGLARSTNLESPDGAMEQWARGQAAA